MTKKRLFILQIFMSVLCCSLLFVIQAHGTDESDGTLLDLFGPVEVNGFLEFRAGCRTQDDPYEKDISLAEARLQMELFTYTDWVELKYKGDVWADGVTEQGEYDTREAWFFLRPTEVVDIKVGRQVLTWGTGDLVFLNDMFPKDWQSYFIGRDKQYLKAPSDSAKISYFTDLLSLDVVYTPQFDHDRFITGEYISYWNKSGAELAGQNEIILYDAPDRWFQDDELALRLYRDINNYELALYTYLGFWKRPAGQTASGIAIFPKLNVYGASARGNIGPGIGNIELAYYQSVEDKDGVDPLIDNSEMRYLVGYTQDLAKDFNASLQYYIEQLLDYSEYKASSTGESIRDRNRHVITLQLTKLLLNQNLELALSTYYSPSDQDTYLRPHMLYKYSDKTTLETGANIFFGENPQTFFAQFENNTNIYLAVRYSF